MSSSAERAPAPARRRRVAGTRRPVPAGPTPKADTRRGPSIRSLRIDGNPGGDRGTTPDLVAGSPRVRKARPKRVGSERHTLLVPALAAGLALLLLAAVLVHALRPGLSTSDRQAAVSSARTSLESLLSYSADQFDEHVAQVTPRLTSPFREQFAKVAASDIKPMAVDNDATVQALVYDAGVMDVAGDGSAGSTVRVMAFVNQATTTTKQPQPAIDQNRVIATMTKVGDRWLISALDAY